MTMNHIIQERRKALGFTQEQVAEYLGVSTPAVNKWERGITCPDISLLAPLARLLKIDLNTLFSFNQSLTDEEIIRIQEEILHVVNDSGIESGFQAARKKIQEYPDCCSLIHNLALILEGSLVMSGLTSDEKTIYDECLTDWYTRASQSKDMQIRNSSLFMLTSRALRKEDYEEAQELLDQLPERTAINKQTLQIELLLGKGQTTEACELAERLVLQAVSDMQNTLLKLLECELADGQKETAAQIADISSKTSPLFGLWDYNAPLAPMILAVENKDVESSILLLKKLLKAASSPWNTEDSPLFHRILKKTGTGLTYEKLLPPLLADLKSNPKYDFLRQKKEFLELIKE